MKTKNETHTPGPWIAWEESADIEITTPDAMFRIGQVYEGEHDVADARLIAAAPDLLEAAKYAQARIGNCWGIRKRVNRDFPHDCRTDALCPPCRLSAAIAKAKEGR